MTDVKRNSIPQFVVFGVLALLAQPATAQLYSGMTAAACSARGGQIVTWTNTAGVGPNVGECYVPPRSGGGGRVGVPSGGGRVGAALGAASIFLDALSVLLDSAPEAAAAPPRGSWEEYRNSEEYRRQQREEDEKDIRENRQRTATLDNKIDQLSDLIRAGPTKPSAPRDQCAGFPPGPAGLAQCYEAIASTLDAQAGSCTNGCREVMLRAAASARCVAALAPEQSTLSAIVAKCAENPGSGLTRVASVATASQADASRATDSMTTVPNSRGEVYSIVRAPIPPGTPAYSRYFYDPTRENCAAARDFDKKSAAWGVLCARTIAAANRPASASIQTGARTTAASTRNSVLGGTRSCASYSADAILEPYWGFNRALSGRTMCSVPNVSEQQCKNVGGDWKPDNGSGKVICFLPVLADVVPRQGSRSRPDVNSIAQAPLAAAAPAPLATLEPATDLTFEAEQGFFLPPEQNPTSPRGRKRRENDDFRDYLGNLFDQGVIDQTALRSALAGNREQMLHEYAQSTQDAHSPDTSTGASPTGRAGTDIWSDRDETVRDLAGAAPILAEWEKRDGADAIRPIPGNLGYVNLNHDVTLWIDVYCATGDYECLAHSLRYLDAYATPGGLWELGRPTGIEDPYGYGLDLVKKIIMAAMLQDYRALGKLVCKLGEKSGLAARDTDKPDAKLFWDQACELGLAYGEPESVGIVLKGQKSQRDALMAAWVINKAKPKIDEALASLKDMSAKLQDKRLADSMNDSLGAAERNRAKADYERVNWANGETEKFIDAIDRVSETDLYAGKSR